VSNHSPSSRTPAANHFPISRTTRLSAIRCSRNFTSHDRSRLPKKSLMPASSTQFTFLRVIPTANASSASWAERAGRNPYERPRKSASYTALITSTTARWRILSSNQATPSGRSPASGFGMKHPASRSRPVRPTMDPSMQILKVALGILPVVPPRHPVHPRGGVRLIARYASRNRSTVT
jgi:hypothetical protein